MPRGGGTTSAARAKGQRSLNSFISVKSTKKKQEKDVEGDESDAEGEEASGLAANVADTADLPPIVDIPDIFADMVKRIPQLKDVAQRVKGRKLRVATMCSGTESPLLALEQIRRAILDQHGIDLQIEHVFSCEIEPFKQGYIERNFSPPILFRDVCELGQTHATTAYGATVAVPGDVDILIAGTSCVDYSNLNNEKQGIEAGGESGRTFHGMLSWVANHRPPIVILENVCSAPWGRVIQKFNAKGYAAHHMKVDTKKYYIPHTRTRGYLLAVDGRDSSVPEKWGKMVKELERPATCTLDHFLLASDDPRIHHARQNLVHTSERGRTDWARCEARHARARVEENLGQKRPLTNWNEDGSSKMPEGHWGDWASHQVERVKDLLDISFLRAAMRNYDSTSKTIVWNCSQNVDREIGSKRAGICPCLTPSMIPYITNRGGPMVGIEALSMQGLPIDELLLTKESEDQLADLAGNAMSSTVVGTCMIAALVLGIKHLRKGSGVKEADVMEVDDDVVAVYTPAIAKEKLEDHIAGDDQLIEKTLDLDTIAEEPMSQLLEEATSSARLCECEGREGVTERALNRCTTCLSTSCVKCGGRPEHNFVPIDIQKEPRSSPLAFAKKLKRSLPMSLSLANITTDLLEELRENAELEENKLWKAWTTAVMRATESSLRFVDLKRQEIWMAVYESASAYAELSLHPHQPEWRVFAKPETNEPAKSPLRALLELPIGRISCDGGWLSGTWEFALPQETTVPVNISGEGDLVPAWEARLGLQTPEFREKTVYSQLRISMDEDDVGKLDRDISGLYTLHDKCGTPCNALHRLESTKSDALPLFLLLDPTRNGDAKEDCFVFSTSRRRYDFGESRPIIARLAPSWRQGTVKEQESSVKCTMPCLWTPAKSVHIQPTSVAGATFAIPGAELDIDASSEACSSATALLTVHVPLGEQAGPEWPRGMIKEVDKVHERATFKQIAWLLERIRDVGDQFSDWQACGELEGLCQCERCAPRSPSLRWMKQKNRIVAVEDSVQAGEYERRLKRRPTPFVTQLHLTEDGSGVVRIGANISSLIHRAWSRLPTLDRTATPSIAWRINTQYVPIAKLELPKFILRSNKLDPEHEQPNFRKKLRPEQLRSLDWMLRMEAEDAAPFVEEEITEAILAPLGWRAEARAQRITHIKGGVLADQVGYGKTAITLGLIDSTRSSVRKELKEMEEIDGKLKTHATLVIVPPHLTGQWKKECEKFLADYKKYNIVVLSTVVNLNTLTIEEIVDADIVIVASSIFHSGVYLDNLSELGTAGQLPVQDGRYFEARLDATLAGLRDQVKRLQSDGSASVLKEVREAHKKADQIAAEAFVQKKRLVGAAYRDATKVAEQSSSAAPSGSEWESAPSSPPVVVKRDVMESVYITTLPYGQKDREGTAPPSSNPPSSAPASDDEQMSDGPRRLRRRVSAPTVVEISSDEAFASEGETKRTAKKGARTIKSKGQAKLKPKRKVKEDSDYEMSGNDAPSSTGPSDDEDEASASAEEESDQEETPKRKAAASKGNGRSFKGRRAAESSDADEVDEQQSDSDDDVKSKTKGKAKTNGASKAKAAAGKPVRKRKSDDEDDQRPAKKQKRRADTDPWKLGARATQNDFTLMHAPPLEMFHFARIVVDEYTYLKGKTHSVVTRLTANRHWVLSGTPPLKDFSAVKTIAAFMHLHLGIDDEVVGQSARKRSSRDQTAVEKFHSFREVRSLEWHAHRHEVGQGFLDQYVRQNIAEIDEIPCEEHEVCVELPAAERAIYLELEHHFVAVDMTMRRGKKGESDRDKRLTQSLGDSSTPEEALLKRCSHFDLEADHSSDKKGKGKAKGKGKKKAANASDDESMNEDEEDEKTVSKPSQLKTAVKACDYIVDERNRQLEETKKDLIKHLEKGLSMERKIGRVSEESSFREFVRNTRAQGLEDPDATVAIEATFEDVGIDGGKLKNVTNTASDANATKAKAAKGKDKGGKNGDSLTKDQKELMWDLREHTHHIRRLAKELVGRERSLRYFSIVRDLQKGQTHVPECPSCGRKNVPVEEIGVLSSCGHLGCIGCVEAATEREECVALRALNCRAAARRLNIVRGNTLGVDESVKKAGERYFGKKIEEMVKLIKNDDHIAKDDRILIFVQFPDLMKKVGEALKHHKVPFLEIKGNATQKSKNLTAFQDGSKERVLLLNVMDESASGANLTGANHAIFLSPLLTPTKEIYDANETQAIGRVRRYGQVKPVHIWRFLTLNTIDTEIYEKRKAELR